MPAIWLIYYNKKTFGESNGSCEQNQPHCRGGE